VYNGSAWSLVGSGYGTVTNVTASSPISVINGTTTPAITLGTVGLANGGTGATTQVGAAAAILPSQAGNSGKYLTTDGSTASWAVTAGGVSDNSIATVHIQDGAVTEAKLDSALRAKINSIVIDSDYFVPSTNLTITTASATMTACWPPQANASQYKIYISPVGSPVDFNSAPAATLTPAQTCYSFSGLTNGLQYQAFVRTIGVPSGAQAVVVVGTSISNLVVDSFDMNSGTTAALSWNAFVGAHHYRLEYNPGESISGPTIIDPVASPTALTGLIKGTTYTYRLTALDASNNTLATRTVSQVCNDFITVKLYGSGNTAYRAWTAIDAITGQPEAAVTAQRYLAPASYSDHRYSSAKYRYQGDTGSGVYRVHPDRTMATAVSIYSDMSTSTAEQSVFYLQNPGMNDQLSLSAASNYTNTVDDHDNVALSLTGEGIISVAGGEDFTQVINILNRSGGYDTTSRALSSFIGGNAFSASGTTAFFIPFHAPKIAVVVDTANQRLDWMQNGTSYSSTFAGLGITGFASVSHPYLICDGVNRATIGIIGGVAYTLTFDWNLHSVTATANANGLQTRYFAPEEKSYGEQIFTVNGKAFYVSATSAGSSITFTHGGTLTNPRSATGATTHIVSRSGIGYGSQGCSDVFFMINSSNYVVFGDHDHDSTGSFFGTPSGDDAYFWWVTSNVQYLPGNL
jgi:hypothetical protein